jgi:hypothetical protein
MQRLQSRFRHGALALALLLMTGLVAFLVPQFTYNPFKALNDPRMLEARKQLRDDQPEAAARLLSEMKEDLWMSGLPDAFLASAAHLRYHRDHDAQNLDTMRQHLQSSDAKEQSLPQKYFAAVYAAETGDRAEALELFDSCYKTMTLPARVWDDHIDRGTFNGNIGLWRKALRSENTSARAPVLYGL